MTLYVDEFLCPLPAGAIARSVWNYSTRRARLYHLGDENGCHVGRSDRRCRDPELQGHLVEGSARIMPVPPGLQIFH